jgi:DeoR/GlpR family transcriptional regulator of sugar metabolism
MAEIGKRDGVVTRKQVAEYFGVDVKTIQRMEAKGVLTRCPGLLGAVRYRARDVLRLASAPGKER